MKKVYEKAEVKVYEMEIEYNMCQSVGVDENPWKDGESEGTPT